MRFVHRFLVALALIVPPARAELESFGPISPAHGFPVYYRDRTGLALQPCLTDPVACAFGALPSPTQPIAFPGNFPDEFFYSFAEARFDTNNGGNGFVRMAIEGAFAGGPVRRGDQVVFARVRVRVDNLVQGATYRLTFPFGVREFVAESSGPNSINVTEDVGLCRQGFAEALSGPIGPFLRWDPAVLPLPPAGTVGDGVTEHAVVGSPFGANFVLLEGPDITGPGQDTVFTDQFTVIGNEYAGALPSPLWVERATYARDANAGLVSVYATSVASLHLEAKGPGLPTTGMLVEPDQGRFYAVLAPANPAILPEFVTVCDAQAPQVTRQDKRLVDEVHVLDASYDPIAQTLHVSARSSDELVPPVLTVPVLGDLDASGQLTVAAPNGPPSSITVLSSAGGSETVRVRTVLGSVPPPGPPVANAGPDVTLLSGAIANLDAAASTGFITSYLWSQTSGPLVSIQNANAAQATFQTPVGPGDVVLQLMVSGPGGSSVDDLVVHVLPLPPLALAGPDLSVVPGQVGVLLDGSASTGAITTYLWEQLVGTPVVLATPNAAQTTFTFPPTPESLTFRLTVAGPGGATTDLVAVIGAPLPAPEVVLFTRAEYRTGPQRWVLRGTSSVPGPGNSVVLTVGNTGSGAVIATAPVTAAGAWAIDIAGSPVLPDTTSTVSVQGASGGQFLGFPLRIRP